VIPVVVGSSPIIHPIFYIVSYQNLNFQLNTQNIQLQTNQIHLWQLSFKNPSVQYWNLCSKEEQARAKRYLRPIQGEQFIFFRSAIRTILASYLKKSATELIFKTTTEGKPYLLENLTFNLSHCEQTAVLAVAQNIELGIDIEKINLSKQWQGIAEKMFTLEKCQNLLAPMTDYQKATLFTTYWTELEALQKCLGTGLFKEKACLEDFSTFYSKTLSPYLICLAWQKRNLKKEPEIMGYYF
jgi:phosphopantetheinyl transferase